MEKKTAATRVLLCLAGLTLVGVTALALGSKDGIITINGGRMTVAMRGPSEFFTPMERDEAGLKTIYSNLGTGRRVYDDSTGWTIGGAGSPVGQMWVAEPFTPTSDATVTRLKVAVGYVTGTNGVSIALADDKEGVPGKFLKQWFKTGLPNGGTCCVLQVENDAAGIPVKAGVQYWVVVKTSAKTNDTWDDFDFSNHASSQMATNTGSGWIKAGYNRQGAFGVFGK
jgi:hypothetical protein